MYGAILGDIIGQPYEFDRGNKTKDFPLFAKVPHWTDDSVMTIAICDGILKAGLDADEQTMKTAMITSCQLWGHKYPYAGYGGRFFQWLAKESTKPYGSYGNGSAMRVASVGWLFETLERTREVARWSAEITHNHPEGVKGAESVAAVIWMARNGKSKDEIKEYVICEFGYDLSRTCDEIRPEYFHQESCQKTVPEAMTAFFEGKDLEDVIRTAVSLGGDCDTLTDIATAMGEAFYGMNDDLRRAVMQYTTEDMHGVLMEFDNVKIQRVQDKGKVVVWAQKAEYGKDDIICPKCGKEILTEKGFICWNQQKRVYNYSMTNRVTNPRITKLEKNEIFVFGSNLAGMHAGGAARFAADKFGAVWGQGVGLQGQSYAIPTMQGGVETIKPYVDDFVKFASAHTEYDFLVTRIGCGIAGFTDEEIAPLFEGCKALENVALPEEWWGILGCQ